MDTKIKQKIVISAVNLVEGGPLTVLRECVVAAEELLGNDWEIIVLVNQSSLIETSGVTCLEFPLAKRSWFIRLYYEWWHFRKLSKIIKPDIWLSLHDITAWVEAPRQIVYCHNAAPFFKISLREAWLEPTLLMFNLFYRHLYGIGIRRNKYVIVQQEWLRQEFKHLFAVQNVIVAHPVISFQQNIIPRQKNSDEKFVFFYPTLSRVFKNIELVCEAAKHLNQDGISGFEIRLTIDGSENKYAANLIKHYDNTDGIAFIGRQNQKEMMSQYDESDCVLFPSRLETWGLPISEAKALGKPLLIAELPYAHETVGTYDKVSFIDPFDAKGLANNMKSIMDGAFNFSGAVATPPEPPFVSNWRELLMLLTAKQ